MKTIKQLIKKVCHDDRFYSSVEKSLAEIYTKGDTLPLCLVEFEKTTGMFFINFRIGVAQCVVADLTYRMTINTPNIVILEDFIIHNERGIIYGEEAQSLFYLSVYDSIGDAVQKQDMGIAGATYVVKEPLNVFTDRKDYSSKIKQLWIDEDF